MITGIVESEEQNIRVRDHIVGIELDQEALLIGSLESLNMIPTPLQQVIGVCVGMLGDKEAFFVEVIQIIIQIRHRIPGVIPTHQTVNKVYVLVGPHVDSVQGFVLRLTQV